MKLIKVTAIIEVPDHTTTLQVSDLFSDLIDSKEGWLEGIMTVHEQSNIQS